MQKTVEERFSVEKIAKEYERFYKNPRGPTYVN